MPSNGPFSDAFTDAFDINITGPLPDECPNPFSDAFSEVFDSCTDGGIPPIGNCKGLAHFRSRHFSKLRHFLVAHFAGCSITIEVTPPPNIGGGGGGRFPALLKGPGYYSLDPRYLTRTTRHVIITVKLTDDMQWKKHYVVETEKAEFIISVMNWVDSVRSRIRIGVDHVKKVTNKVTAMFRNKDK
jgi:hypothetical protein